MASGRHSRLSSQLRRAPTRYRPLERIAVGGMAEVWRGEAIFEDGSRQVVAIKRVLPALASEPVYRSMFVDEARLGMLLRHRNIVRVYDAREVAGTYIMIMELVDGTSLKSMLDRAHARGACMPLPAALYVARELLEALDYAHLLHDEQGAHLGIIHRDVSPHNVLLGKNGDVKLADFGLADAKVHETIKGDALVGGKLGYLAPEIVGGVQGDHRVDLFAAGVVLWEALAGRRLFQGRDDTETVRNVATADIPPPSRFNPALPPEVDDFVLHALERDPSLRFPSAAAFRDGLDELLTRYGQGVGSRDVALLVSMHLAAVRLDPIARPGIEGLVSLDALAAELDAFAQEAAADEAGAVPLDPSEFESPGIHSGVRRHPAPPATTAPDDDWFDGR
ncbi:MAG: serine/threonine protein kinase [Myxococcota bacterium]|nr:serine/threonine protein kinase [Myxococcota bacterium]MDW8361920.1 serine/threonine-protein kinase [Myxococcales bacterium]